MRIADLRTTELQRVGSAVLRAYVDATAGRNVGELSRWLIEGVSAPLPVDDGNQERTTVGAVTVLRQGTDRAHVSATLRTVDGATAGTIACELRSEAGVVRAARIGQVPVTAPELDEATKWVLEPEPPEHLTRMLGPVPTSIAARTRWTTAAAIVAEYRETWGIEESSSALGPVPVNPEQLQERHRAVESLRDLLDEIARIEPRPAVARDLDPPGLTR